MGGMREPDFPQWCPLTGQDAVGRNLKNFKFHLNTKQLFYCEGSQTPEQAAQRGYKVFILGDIHNPTRHSCV